MKEKEENKQKTEAAKEERKKMREEKSQRKCGKTTKNKSSGKASTSTKNKSSGKAQFYEYLQKKLVNCKDFKELKDVCEEVAPTLGNLSFSDIDTCAGITDPITLDLLYQWIRIDPTADIRHMLAR